MLEPGSALTKHYTQAQVETGLRASLDTLIDALADGDDLRVESLGRLWVEEKPLTHKVSNLSGQPTPYTLCPRRVMRFRASSHLLLKLNRNT